MPYTFRLPDKFRIPKFEPQTIQSLPAPYKGTSVTTLSKMPQRKAIMNRRKPSAHLKPSAHRNANSNLALKAYRLAKRNAKSIDYDHLQEDNQNTSVKTTTGWQVKEFGVAQGDGTGTRQGDEIFIRKLWCKGLCKTIAATTQSTAILRPIVTGKPVVVLTDVF
jgi:hypothetical protein